MAFINDHLGKYPLVIMLEVLGIKRSYWDKYKKAPGKKAISDKFLLQAITEVFESNLRQYGYRRITTHLRTLGWRVNHKRVHRIMAENGICAQYVRKMRKNAKTRARGLNCHNDYPDLVQRNFASVKERFTVLYTDVTYLILNKEKYYQSTIIDGYTREIIDYQISPHNDLKLVMNNLDATVEKIKRTKSDPRGIIIHSDHGSQYHIQRLQSKM